MWHNALMDRLTAQTPAVRNAAAAQQAALDELVAMAAAHALEALPQVASRMAGALLDMSAAGSDPQDAVRRIRSGNLLKDNAYAFVHLASTAIEVALRREVAQLAPHPKPTQAAPLTLSLVPLEEIDDRLAFAAISRPFDIACSEALASLGVRLGLLLGRELVRAAHNPFRPEVFLRALREAWREFEPEADSHELIVALLRPAVVFELAPLLERLGEKLKPARARAGAEERFAKTDDSAAARAARARRDAAVSQGLRQLFGGADGAPGADLDIPLIANLPQGSGGWRPSAAAGFAVSASTSAPTAAPSASLAGLASATPAAQPHAAPGQSSTPHVAVMAPGAATGAGGAVAMAALPAIPAPLIEVLEKLAAHSATHAQPASLAATGASPHDVFYLPRLKQSLPQGSLSRGDSTTLDLLGRIFEAVLLDESIPQETRELIAFLQEPVLKSALKDRSFFFEEAHPARRMLELLSSAGWERPAGVDDPVFRAMRHGVELVAREARPETFAAAVAELEASLAERERLIEAAIAGPIAQATRQEKQGAARRSAQKAVTLRLAGEQVVALVGAFLEQRWIPVLTLAYTIEDSKPGAIDNATRAMDELIWSVKPKTTQEGRQALIKRLPSLLSTLNKWLDATGWQDAERLQFFAGLAECHAAIVRAPIDLSPERQLELAVEAAQQDALRRIAQEQAAAEQEEGESARDAGADPAAASLAALVRGARVEFAGKEGARKLKLAWVSPLRTLFIFSGAGRKEAFSLAAERLLDAFRSGSIRVLAPEGVVGRVLTEAAGEAAMNDPAGGASNPGRTAAS